MEEYKVELLNPAWLDLDAISDFHLLKVRPESARRITDKILTALERLEFFPLSCPLAPYRELVEKGFRILVSGQYVIVAENA